MQDDTGVNRQWKPPLWAQDDTGVNRKPKAAWMQDDTSVNRKIFAGGIARVYSGNKLCTVNDAYRLVEIMTLPGTVTAVSYDGVTIGIGTDVYTVSGSMATKVQTLTGRINAISNDGVYVGTYDDSAYRVYKKSGATYSLVYTKTGWPAEYSDTSGYIATAKLSPNGQYLCLFRAGTFVDDSQWTGGPTQLYIYQKNSSDQYTTQIYYKQLEPSSSYPTMTPGDDKDDIVIEWSGNSQYLYAETGYSAFNTSSNGVGTKHDLKIDGATVTELSAIRTQEDLFDIEDIGFSLSYDGMVGIHYWDESASDPMGAMIKVRASSTSALPRGLGPVHYTGYNNPNVCCSLDGNVVLITLSGTPTDGSRYNVYFYDKQANLLNSYYDANIAIVSPPNKIFMLPI